MTVAFAPLMTARKRDHEASCAGGEDFTLAQPASIPNFVNSVNQIVTEYGFDGIHIDFETRLLDPDPECRMSFCSLPPQPWLR
jgi:hypothetical protein